MKNLKKSQAQFLEYLRRLRLRQNDGFLIKNKKFKVITIQCFTFKIITHLGD